MILSLSEFQAACEATTTSYGRALLLGYATAAGTDYFNLYHKHFPVADQANEQQTNNDTMKIELNITADPVITDAINNLASAISGRTTFSPSEKAQVATAVKEATAPKETLKDVVEGEVITKTPEEPAPKKKRESKAEKPAPAPEPEPEPEEVVPTGPELVARIEPIKKTQYTKDLRAYMDTDLGLSGAKLVDITDKDVLKKLDEKITELLQQAEDDRNAEV